MENDVNKKRINVLVVSVSAWREDKAFGNTCSNFFGEWHDANLLNLYLRTELPQNNVCSRYFNITEKQIIKNFFSPRHIGNDFDKEYINEILKKEQVSKSVGQDKRIQKTLLSVSEEMFFLATELLWKFGAWKNKKLNDFLNQKIDIIFAPASKNIYLSSIVEYCRKQTGAKLVFFFGDDVFFWKSKNPLKYLRKAPLQQEVKKTAGRAVKLYGASKKLCDEYEKYLGKEIEPLYKGCLFDRFGVKKSVSKPIKIVYAGNLLYGRWITLDALAQAIEKINAGGEKITLEIYTTAAVTPLLEIALNRGNSSKIMGARPYEEIKVILASADIVLHVESFEEEAILTTRLSFSTKIIDAMQSGSCLMAIGPDCVASIEYLESLKGAIVVTDLKKIDNTIIKIIENPDDITSKALLLREYAKAHHDLAVVREKLQSDFIALARSG